VLPPAARLAVLSASARESRSQWNFTTGPSPSAGC
jgi:hypothetical protein